MKKWMILLCVFLVILCSSCGLNGSNSNSEIKLPDKSSWDKESSSPVQSVTDSDALPDASTSGYPNSGVRKADAGVPPKYKPGSIKLLSQENIEYDFKFEMHYRCVYYVVYSEYFELVDDQNAVNVWYRSFDQNNQVNEIREMMLVAFIRNFGITRGQFDQATEQYKKACNLLKQDVMSEKFEIPNGDIIYTFDNAIINEYYLRG